MQQWDYEVREIQRVGKTKDIEALLKSFGDIGFELVSLTPVANSALVPANTSHLLAVFKRPRPVQDQYGQPQQRVF